MENVVILMHDSVSNDDEDWQKIQEMMPGWIIVCRRILGMFDRNYKDVLDEQKWSYLYLTAPNQLTISILSSRDELLTILMDL